MVLSILHPDGPPTENVDAPRYFTDLNLNQAVSALLVGREDYRLTPLLYGRLTDARPIGYRHALFADLDANLAPTERIDRFAADMRAGEATRAARNRHEPQSNGCTPRCGLDLTSAALHRVYNHLDTLTGDPAFLKLAAHADTMHKGLSDIGYCVDIHNDRVRVTRYDDEPGVERTRGHG